MLLTLLLINAQPCQAASENPASPNKLPSGSQAIPLEVVTFDPDGIDPSAPAFPTACPDPTTSNKTTMTAEQTEEQAPSPTLKPLVLSSTKIGIPLDRQGGSATIITHQQLQNMQAISLLEALQQVPGLDIVQNGGLGSTSSIFIRGANSEQTLVLVDGIRLNDPISPGRSFQYLDQINPDLVEQVEVLRGPQGPLFGSDGIGGVINIVTRQGEGRPTLYGKVQAGSYHSLQSQLGASGTALHQKLRLFLHATRQDTQGFSAASNRYGNQERDGFHNTTLMGKLLFQASEHARFTAFSTWSRAKAGLDNFGGLGGDDPNYTANNQLFMLGGESRITRLNNRFEQIIRASVTDQQRDTRNDTDWAHPFDSERSAFNSRLFALDMINNMHLSPSNTLTVGLNVQHETGDMQTHLQSAFGPFDSAFQNRSATDVAFYAQDYFSIRNKLFTTVSIRHDHHNRFGNAMTYHATSTFPIRKTGTTFKASYGTAFKAPTLYQLFSNYGNPSLSPESSIGWDAGIEQALFQNRLNVGVTYFQNQIKNLIQFSPLFTYENIANVRTQGLEVFANAHPLKTLSLQASYTYTDAKDPISGDPLLRRPRNKLSLSMNYQPHPKVSINLNASHIGQRNDLDFNVFPVRLTKLTPVTLINVALRYDVTPHMNVFAKLVNLLDTPYESVKGYGMPRISAYGGIGLTL